MKTTLTVLCQVSALLRHNFAGEIGFPVMSIFQPQCPMRQSMVTSFRFLMWPVLLLLALSGCKSGSDPDPQNVSDSSLSCVINGKTITDNSPIINYSSGLLDLTSVLALSSSEGFILSLKVLASKTGTFSSKTGAVYGNAGYLAGAVSTSSTKDYALTKTIESTVTFTAFDTKGYAEGTFSLTGTATDGKTASFTSGKFRLKLL